MSEWIIAPKKLMQHSRGRLPEVLVIAPESPELLRAVVLVGTICGFSVEISERVPEVKTALEV